MKKLFILTILFSMVALTSCKTVYVPKTADSKTFRMPLVQTWDLALECIKRKRLKITEVDKETYKITVDDGKVFLTSDKQIMELQFTDMGDSTKVTAAQFNFLGTNGLLAEGMDDFLEDMMDLARFRRYSAVPLSEGYVTEEKN